MYLLEEERYNKEKKFIDLTQGIMTMREYTTKFERLSHFAPHMVDTPRKKIKKYH